LSRPSELEARLDHRFGDIALLEQALTHRSFGPQHNERLEFLGDGVLGCAIAEELYSRFPSLPEGKLTRLRASLVCEQALVEIAVDLAIAGMLRRGEGELSGDPQPRPSLLADAVEAVVGAVFVDGGYGAARRTVLRTFKPLLERLDPAQAAKDAKTQLQEILQSERRPLPQYRIVAIRGAAHRQSFEVECTLADRALATSGSGTSRQRAEQEAALAMLAKLRE
jgi:ribonuclease III